MHIRAPHKSSSYLDWQPHWLSDNNIITRKLWKKSSRVASAINPASAFAGSTQLRQLGRRWEAFRQTCRMRSILTRGKKVTTNCTRELNFQIENLKLTATHFEGGFGASFRILDRIRGLTRRLVSPFGLSRWSTLCCSRLLPPPVLSRHLRYK